MSIHPPELTWPLSDDQMAMIRRKASQERAAVAAEIGRGIARTVKRLFYLGTTRPSAGRVTHQAT